ncbi:Aste57867_5826 [Aphanomyces stellatus]|uniref:Aste57867_5826 protein n=1 Tax=Aphanomyces stellatus TaxID=120398 RepID=A0A485KDF2_9STRA|nr:hypothetical protein As57867_005812 [Aphanomyces stellatus]VFT82849.1 Aste57867_5826 [Aphanomyces stellatus]
MSMDHQVAAATSFFTTFRSFGRDTCAVVFGHNQQGKTQLLYFAAKLLIGLGEGVVYLDQSIAPVEGMGAATVIDEDCCINLWQPALETFLTRQGGKYQQVIDALRAFGGTSNSDSSRDQLGNPRDFMVLNGELHHKSTKFPVSWPEEQNLTAFHCVLMGSVGMATFVAKRHLDKQVWDLPLFDRQETAILALRLQAALGIDTDVVEGALGLTLNDDDEQKMVNIGDVLGFFGGVATSSDSSRHSKALGTNAEYQARLWLDKMAGVKDPWFYARNADLCGSTLPRGVIFRQMLEALFFHIRQDNALRIVSNFRHHFNEDPGLEGILMELEIILKLLHKEPIIAALIKLDGGQWVPQTEKTIVPPHTTNPKVWTWDCEKMRLAAIIIVPDGIACCCPLDFACWTCF